MALMSALPTVALKALMTRRWAGRDMPSTTSTSILTGVMQALPLTREGTREGVLELW